MSNNPRTKLSAASFVQTCWFNGTCPKCLRATATDGKGHTWCTNPRCVDSTSEDRPA